MQGDWPSVLISRGWSVPCVASIITQDLQMDESGINVPEQWDVMYAKNDLPHVIDQRETVTLDGFTCQVSGQEIDEKTNTIRLTLKRT